MDAPIFWANKRVTVGLIANINMKLDPIRPAFRAVADVSSERVDSRKDVPVGHENHVLTVPIEEARCGSERNIVEEKVQLRCTHGGTVHSPRPRSSLT